MVDFFPPRDGDAGLGMEAHHTAGAPINVEKTFKLSWNLLRNWWGFPLHRENKI